MRVQQKTLLLGFTVLTIFLLTRNTPAQGPASDSAAAALDRALAAHGRQLVSDDITDSAGTGKLTLFGLEGPKAAFDFTLLRKGNAQVQRVIKEPAGELKQSSDGTNTWESIAGFYTPAAQGRALQFIESQTTRSVPRLFNYQKEGLTVRDLGMQDKARVIEAEDRQGRKTSYFIDPDKYLITKCEFVTGQTRDPFSGAMIVDTDAYVFSDYRPIQGILTPFKIERYSGRNKTEEMQFSVFKYNTGLKDADFRR